MPESASAADSVAAVHAHPPSPIRRGVVRWSRESSDGGHDAPPGFGAQFTQITAEARQLIYRYVRNREPLFHDDL